MTRRSPRGQLERYVAELEEKIREAAQKFEFERAAQLRDRLKALRTRALEIQSLMSRITSGAPR